MTLAFAVMEAPAVLIFSISKVLVLLPPITFPVPGKLYIWVLAPLFNVPLLVKLPLKVIAPDCEVEYVTPAPSVKSPLIVNVPAPLGDVDQFPDVLSKIKFSYTLPEVVTGGVTDPLPLYIQVQPEF